VTGALNGSISASRFRSHITSRAASEAVIYLASHVDSATIGYLLNPQAMGALAPKKKYPLVDLQVETSPAQSESV
jgi:hypothetical protein